MGLHTRESGLTVAHVDESCKKVRFLDGDQFHTNDSPSDRALFIYIRKKKGGGGKENLEPVVENSSVVLYKDKM